MRYDAFISYSHAADGKLAPALQAGLQRFAKPWYRRRALTVFRDDTGLSANPGLWSSITDAMEDSRYFLLLASPESAQSVWVAREIEHWRSGDNGPLLPVLTDGEIVWDEDTGDFDWEASTALSPALKGYFTEEPRHIDLRFAHSETDLSLRHSGFRAGVAELAAPLRGIPKDELEGEEIRQHRRAIALAWFTGVLLFLLTTAAVIGAIFAVRFANDARDNEREARANLERALDGEQLAQDNAEDADAQRAQAEENATKAEENAAEALANALEAEQNAMEAAENAEEALTQQERAELNAAEALAQQEQAEAAREAEEQQRALAESNAAEALRNELLANDNANLAQQQAAAAVVARQQAETAEADAVSQRNIATAERDRAVAAEADAVEQERLAAEERDRAVAAEAEALRQQALAVSRQQANQAIATLSRSNIDLALLLAVEAAAADTANTAGAQDSATAQTSDAVGSLLSTVLEAERGIIDILQIGGQEQPAAFGLVAVSDNARYVAAIEQSASGLNTTGSNPIRVVIWDRDSDAPPRQIVLPAAIVVEAAFGGGDSSLLMLTGLRSDETITTMLLEASTGEILFERADSVLYYPDDRNIAVLFDFAEGTFFLDSTTGAVVGADQASFALFEQLGLGQTFSTDGRWMLGFDGLGLPTVWDLHSPGVPSTTLGFLFDASISQQYFDPSSQVVVAVSAYLDGEEGGGSLVEIADIASGAVIVQLAPPEPVQSAAVRGDLGEVSALGISGTVWRLIEGQWVPGVNVGFSDLVSRIDYDPSGQYTIVSRSTRGDAEDRGATTVLSGDTTVLTTTRARVVVAEQGTSLVTIDDDPLASIIGGQVTMWSLPDGEPLRVSNFDTNEAVLVDDTGSQLVVGDAVDQDRQIWDLNVPTRRPITLPGSIRTIGAATLSGDGQVIVGVGLNGRAIVWRSDARAGGATLEGQQRFGFGAEANFSTDLTLAAGTVDRLSYTILDTTTSEVLSTIELGTAGEAVGAAFFNRTLIVNLVRGDSLIFSADTGELLHQIPGIILATSGTRVLFDDPATANLTIWDLPQATAVTTIDRSHIGAEPLTFQDGGVIFNAYDISPDGTLVAGTNSTGRVALWDLATGQLVGSTEVRTDGASLPRGSVVFSPTTSTIAIKAPGPFLYLWEPATGELRVIDLPTESGTRIMWSPDGTIVASDGGTLWDPVTLGQIGPVLGSSSATADFFFTPDGNEVAKVVWIPELGTTVSTWSIGYTDLINRACALAGRNMSQDEWDLFHPAGTAYERTCAQYPVGAGAG